MFQVLVFSSKIVECVELSVEGGIKQCVLVIGALVIHEPSL